MRVKVSLLVMMLFSVLAGCNSAPQKNTSPPTTDQQHQIKVQQTIPEKRDIKNPAEVAAHLESLVERIPQVKSANCVVIGNTAIVGIDVDGSLDRSRVGVIKYSVSEALRKDPYGAHAIVTADMDINARLREIRDEIRNGRPISGFAEELGAIIGRIMPQLPRDVLPENEQPVKSEDQQKLPQRHL